MVRRTAVSTGFARPTILRLAVLIVAASCQSAAQQYNIADCTFPPRLTAASMPSCPRVQNVSVAEAKANAWRYAPVVIMHPLEKYHLQDPTVYWNAANLVDAFNEVKEPQEALMAAAQNSFSSFYLLERSYITINNATDKDEVLAGAPINNATGLSSAKVFYTVVDLDERYWVYNYNLFYSFNGCSNQILSLALNGTYESATYTLCPAGIHEGDWERVSVLVCKKEQRVRRVIMSQHAWNEERNCDAGQCTFQGSNPVVHAALDSHANYPLSSVAIVYDQVRLDFLPNLDGIFIIDRTLTGPQPYRRFVPTRDNIRYLETDPNKQNASDTYLWSSYLGTWGAPISLPTYTFTCMNPGQTAVVECPDNDAIDMLDKVTKKLNGKRGSNATVFNAGQQIVSTTVTKTFASDGSSPKGPVTRDYSYYWTPPQEAPLWKPASGVLAFLTNASAAPVCPAAGDPSSSFRVPVKWRNDDLKSYLIGIAVGVIAFSLVMALLLVLPPIIFPEIAAISLLPAAAEGNGAGASPASERSVVRLYARVMPIDHILRVVWVVVALALYIAGAVLVGIGCDSLWHTLENLLSIDLWAVLRKIFVILIVLVGVCDLLFAILLASLHPLHCCALMPASRLNRKMKVAATKAPKRGTVTSAIMTGGILFVISVVILLFAFGVAVTIARKVFAKACRTVVSRADGVVGGNDYCLDLKQFGLDKRYCLTDVANFCNRWEELKVNYIVLGAVLMLWAHFMLLLLVARNFALTREYRLRHEMPLPSTEEHDDEKLSNAKGFD